MNNSFKHAAAAVMLISFISTVSVIQSITRNIPALNRSSVKRSGFPVIIIDPGHGGEDGGAVSSNGIKESVINLSVALKLESVLAFCGVDTVLTRTDESIEYPPNASTVRERKNFDMKRRAAIADLYDNAIFISIHQNKYISPQPHGAQVLYSAVFGSRELAETLQAKLKELDRTNRREAVSAPENLYLMRTIKCPSILLECGFLSNERDIAMLTDNEYQLSIAEAIASAVINR